MLGFTHEEPPSLRRRLQAGDRAAADDITPPRHLRCHYIHAAVIATYADG